MSIKGRIRMYAKEVKDPHICQGKKGSASMSMKVRVHMHANEGCRFYTSDAVVE